MNAIDQSTDEPFAQRLRSAVHPVDVLVLCAIPMVLLGVFTLSAARREALAFSYTDPTVLTAFTANFVHLDVGHLLANLGAYALVVPVVYLLSVLSGKRRRFWIVFTVFLVVFPVALSFLNLAIARPGAGIGFSGINMAFVGYLPIALAGYAAVRFDVGPERDLAGALFFAGIALIAVLSVQSVLTYGLAVAALLAALLYWLSMLEHRGGARFDVRAAVNAAGDFELAVAGIVLFAGLPLIAFPIDPALDAGTVNLYIHLLGYALGFIATYLTVLTMSRFATDDADASVELTV